MMLSTHQQECLQEALERYEKLYPKLTDEPTIFATIKEIANLKMQLPRRANEEKEKSISNLAIDE